MANNGKGEVQVIWNHTSLIRIDSRFIFCIIVK